MTLDDFDSPSKRVSWKPVLQVSSTAWLGIYENTPNTIWLGSFTSAKREVDQTDPIGLLPILERPYHVIEAEIDALDTASDRNLVSLISNLLPDLLIRTAVTTKSDYWVGLSLAWGRRFQAHRQDDNYLVIFKIQTGFHRRTGMLVGASKTIGASRRTDTEAANAGGRRQLNRINPRKCVIESAYVSIRQTAVNRFGGRPGHPVQESRKGDLLSR